MIKNVSHFFFFLTILTLGLSSCQSQLQSGIINYEIELTPNEDGEAMKEAFSEGAKVYFNKNFIKLVKNGNGTGDEFTITDLKKHQESTYLEVMDNKFAVLFDKKNLPKIGEFKVLEEYKTIAGFRCQKAIAPMGEGQMSIYFSKKIKVDYCPYVDIQGFALEYSLAMPYGQLTYTAKEVLPQKVSDQQILPTEKYETVTMDDFNNIMMTLMSGDVKEGTNIDFSKITLDGKLISNSTLKGSVVVLNFWFTSCAPCKAEIPDLNELKKEYKDRPIRFVAITFDPKEIVLDFIKKRPFGFEMITDARDLTRDFEVRAFPTTMILDKNGNIAHRIIGGSINIKKQLKPLIEAELNK